MARVISQLIKDVALPDMYQVEQGFPEAYIPNLSALSYKHRVLFTRRLLWNTLPLHY